MGAKLVRPDGLELDLEDTDAGWILETVEVSRPEVRASVVNRPVANGTIDTTRFSGGRSVTLGMHLVPGDLTVTAMLEALASFLDPSLRFTLWLATEKNGPFKRLAVRADDVSGPFERPGALAVALTLISTGSPFFLGEAFSVDLVANYDLPGRTYDLLFDRRYPWAGTDEVVITNRGDQPAEWTAQFAGPITNPAIVNLTTGEAFYTKANNGTDLVVRNDQTLVIDSATRTVLLDGSSRYANLDFVNSKWWKLPPKSENRLVAGGTDTTPPVQPHPTMFEAHPTILGEMVEVVPPSHCRFAWSDTYLF